MLRKLFFLSLMFVGGVMYAQDGRVDVQDTELMKQKAADRTELVVETIDITTEQKKEIYDVYMWVERQNEAMKHRYKDAPEDYQADVKHMYRVWDNEVDKRFLKILSKDQMNAWVEALR